MDNSQNLITNTTNVDKNPGNLAPSTVSNPIQNSDPKLNAAQSSSLPEPGQGPSGPSPSAQAVKKITAGVSCIKLTQLSSSSGAAKRRARKMRLLKAGPQDRPSTSSTSGCCTATPVASSSTGVLASEKKQDSQDSVKIPLKRNRSDGQSPKESVQKKLRPENPATYRDSLVGIPMVVLPTDYPITKLSDIQVTSIGEALLNVIDNEPAGSTPRQFFGSRTTGGLFRVTCANLETKEWLEVTAAHLKPWEGASLKAIEAKDLPKFSRLVVRVPTDAGEPAKVFDRWMRQNPPVNTKGWKLLSRKAEPSGTILTVSMDDQSLGLLKERDMRLHLGFGTVKFRLIDAGKEKKTVKPPSSSGNSGGSADAGGSSKSTT